VGFYNAVTCYYAGGCAHMVPHTDKLHKGIPPHTGMGKLFNYVATPMHQNVSPGGSRDQ